MAIKVYTANICGSHEVRKRQQRVLFILSTLSLDLEIVDITEPGRENDREFMQDAIKKNNKTHLLPPQIFNNETYCGDYDDFQLAADDDIIMSFLKLEEPPSSKPVTNGVSKDSVTQNGITHENPTESDVIIESTQETGEETLDLSSGNISSENKKEIANEEPSAMEEEESEEEESD